MFKYQIFFLFINFYSFFSILSKTTFMCYMAADNDLYPFTSRNLAQMSQIGSNNNVNIIVHLDMHKPKEQKKVFRCLVQKNKIIKISNDMVLDSGNPETLIDFVRFCKEKYPADDYVLCLWNHGTGILEPIIRKAVNPSKLFVKNSDTNLYELNRSIGFIDYISQYCQDEDHKGICFDDTYRSYLTIEKLNYALNGIYNILGKKLSILACDACLMSMIEVLSSVKDYADFFVGSQEVELGTGYNYNYVLGYFLDRSESKDAFAKHIVSSFELAYKSITHDYTQSATRLDMLSLMEENINNLSNHLIYGLKNQKYKSVKEFIRLSRHKNFCVHFDEPTYIDLDNFYFNLLKNINKITLNSNTKEFKDKLISIISQGRNIISDIVIKNVVGNNLKNAKGLSIYFPEYNIHNSYYNSKFSKNNSWLKFLEIFVKN
jgi:hypothetical protein